MVDLLLLDVQKQTVSKVTIDGENLNDLYKCLNTDCIDCVSRKISGKYYDIWYDDNGRLKSNTIPSAISIDDDGIVNIELVGNLLFALSNKLGCIVSLKDEDIVKIIKSITLLQYKDKHYNKTNSCNVLMIDSRIE